jgi:hypothetical protein|tara:strand:- start:118 stop:819 length:702 start_codon:yes stop_codon:yes gene_type:complete
MQNNSDYQQYVNTTNWLITSLNNNATYLNYTNSIISNMFNRMDDAYTNMLNETSYLPVNNNRRRRLNMPERPATPTPESREEPFIPIPIVAVPVVEPTPDTQQSTSDNIYRDMSVTNLSDVINNNIRKVKYSEVINPIDTVCAISQEEFEPDDIVGVFSNCEHIFNYDALLNWLVRDQTCPCCRRNIMEGSNLIGYVDEQTNQHLFLTLPEFRSFLMRDLFGTIDNTLTMVVR